MKFSDEKLGFQYCLLMSNCAKTICGSCCFLPENKVQTIGELHDQWLSDTERRMMPLLQAQAGRCGFLAEGVWKLSGARDLIQSMLI